MSKLLKERWLRLAFADDSTTAMNELKCWDGYERNYDVPEGKPGSCQKKKNKNESDEHHNGLHETDENLAYKIAKEVIKDPDVEEVEVDGETLPVEMSKKSAEEITGEKAKESVDEAIEEALARWEVLLTEAPKKYDHIDFKPPAGVAKAAERGLELRKKAGGKGGLNQKQAKSAGVGSGVSRASTLKNRKNISPDTAKRMKSFFARHEKNKSIAKGKSAHEDKGYVAWQLWGGNAGQSWANKLVRQMDAADKKAKKK